MNDKTILETELYLLQHRLNDKRGAGKFLSFYGRWWLPMTRKRLEMKIKELEEEIRRL